MKYIDKEKIKRVCETFSLNFEITRLYAAYLEHCPELITREMIDMLCEDGRIGKEEALRAIVTEILGLDEERSPREKRLVRDYIRPSVKLLDKQRYTENKYYKTIKIDNVKDGAWEFKKESYPPYRAMICGDMMLGKDLSEVPPLGFFDEEFLFPAVLEDGNEWMTLTPVDLDTCDEAIERAHGKVVTFGLGLGYYAFMVSEKGDVESITVIEKSDKVIELFKKHILPQFNHPEKVRIIRADAYDYLENEMKAESYDYAFVDIWRDASDGAPVYEKFKRLEHLSGCPKFDYWIEGFLISRLRAQKFESLSDSLESEDGESITYEEFIKQLTEVV